MPEILFPQFAKSSDDMIAAKKGFFCAAVRQCSDVIAKDNFRYIISSNLQAIERKSDWTKKNIASNPTNIGVKRGFLTYQENAALSWTMR